MEHYERHCPLPERRFNCLIPPPNGYKLPIKWPKSRDEVWKANIPHTHLAHEKSDQNWMVVKGEKIVFPGGGTHFHYGADKYIKSLANMLNFSKDNMNNKGNLRTVLDVGCGVASFGGYLLSSDIIAMSLAPNDVHQNQIQFTLERGIPAYLGVLGTKRLPAPGTQPPLCRSDDDPNAVYGVNMEACITPYSDRKFYHIIFIRTSLCVTYLSYARAHIFHK
ncbi:putative S-adenosyl-L-methionine-dependent methyltransferase [Helianthus annuus]|nr:putative S-adenosyl-L-methionine-dependent methyltransferase [Helianthus annuus]